MYYKSLNVVNCKAAYLVRPNLAVPRLKLRPNNSHAAY